MRESTARIWDLQNRHDGDRVRLFRAVQEATGARRALYPGSFVDIAASAAFPAVTYVDSDRRARSFFDDTEGVREVLASMGAADEQTISFIGTDYRDLQLPEQSFDLLISLYAGFVSEHCTDFLRVGGFLLVNPSHGDAAMAAIDSRYILSGVVQSREGRYTVRRDRLEGYLIPRSAVEITPELLHDRGRGIAYTKPAFAYLFRRLL